VKRLWLFLAVLLLVVPATSLAKGPPPSHGGARPSAARAVAAVLCLTELKQLGHDAFKAKYASNAACLDAHADQSAQILETCRTADDPAGCLRQAFGEPVAPARPGGLRGRTLPLTRMVAAVLCGEELKSDGREAFAAKYGTRGSCLRAKASQAAGIVTDAQTQCATASAQAGCVLRAIARALGLPARGPRK
jgi:hypothetical protein